MFSQFLLSCSFRFSVCAQSLQAFIGISHLHGLLLPGPPVVAVRALMRHRRFRDRRAGRSFLLSLCLTQPRRDEHSWYAKKSKKYDNDINHNVIMIGDSPFSFSCLASGSQRYVPPFHRERRDEGYRRDKRTARAVEIGLPKSPQQWWATELRRPVGLRFQN